MALKLGGGVHRKSFCSVFFVVDKETMIFFNRNVCRPQFMS